MIAIVDDDPLVRRAVERVLRASGYMVAVFESGAQLLDSLRASRPACIVLDLHMPKVDGFEVLTILAKEPTPIPVIVATADENPLIAVRVKRLGAVACLKKPVDAGMLLVEISAALQH